MRLFVIAVKPFQTIQRLHKNYSCAWERYARYWSNLHVLSRHWCEPLRTSFTTAMIVPHRFAISLLVKRLLLLEPRSFMTHKQEHLLDLSSCQFHARNMRELPLIDLHFYKSKMFAKEICPSQPVRVFLPAFVRARSNRALQTHRRYCKAGISPCRIC